MCLNKLHSFFSTNCCGTFEMLVKAHVLVVQYERNVLLFNFS